MFTPKNCCRDRNIFGWYGKNYMAPGVPPTPEMRRIYGLYRFTVSGIGLFLWAPEDCRWVATIPVARGGCRFGREYFCPRVERTNFRGCARPKNRVADAFPGRPGSQTPASAGHCPCRQTPRPVPPPPTYGAICVGEGIPPSPGGMDAIPAPCPAQAFRWRRLFPVRRESNP